MAELRYAYTLMFVEGVGGAAWDECLARRRRFADWFESELLRRRRVRCGRDDAGPHRLECSFEDAELDLPGGKRRAAVLKARTSWQGWDIELLASKPRVFAEFDVGWGRWVYGPNGDMWLRHAPKYGHEDPRTMRKAVEDGWAERALREQIERGGGLLNGDRPGTAGQPPDHVR